MRFRARFCRQREIAGIDALAAGEMPPGHNASFAFLFAFHEKAPPKTVMLLLMTGQSTMA